jgi:hypothetical protein
MDQPIVDDDIRLAQTFLPPYGDQARIAWSGSNKINNA